MLPELRVEALRLIHRAKIGPNRRNRRSEGSNSARPQSPDQHKQNFVDHITASHAEGRWFETSRDHSQIRSSEQFSGSLPNVVEDTWNTDRRRDQIPAQRRIGAGVS